MNPITPCACPASPNNPHAGLDRPHNCTFPDPCEACNGTGCDYCGRRGYSQHAERVVVDGVEIPGWEAARRASL